MTPLQAIQSLWPFGGPPERRTESQIDSDLNEEFAFHLEMRTRENMELGCEPDAARKRAITSFGNIESIKRQCRRIALEERIMLQRINLVVMIIVLIVVAMVGVQVLVTQRYNTLALQTITTELADMKVRAQAEERLRQSTSGAVIVEGDVPGVGWQSVDMNKGTTLKQLLQRLNVVPAQWVRYRRTGQPGPTVTRDGSISGTAFLPAKDHLAMQESPLLRPNDEILVRDEPPLADRRTYFLRWLREIAPTFWTATATDGRIFHLAYETLSLRSIRVTLVEHNSPNYYVGGITAQGIHLRAGSQPIVADWDMKDDALLVDFRSASDSRTEMMIDDMPKELAGLALTFTQTNDSSSFQKAREQAGVAEAIERCVIELFGMSTQLDWKAANVDELLKSVIQDGERRAVENEADEIIAEMVRAFYRERVARFEAERKLREAADAQAKSEVLHKFLVQLLVDANPADAQATVVQVLDAAAARASEVYGHDEHALAAVRTAIADAKLKSKDQSASPE